MTSLTVLACQIDIPDIRNCEGRNRHVYNFIAKIDQHLSIRSADLVVLPELTNIDYSRAAFDQLSVLSCTLDSADLDPIKELAACHRTHIVYGVPRRDKKNYYISMLVIGPNGNLLGHYDKLHIAQYGASMEKEYFQRGEHVFTFSVNGFRIAPIICYDIRIPELTRTLCLDHGSHLIVHSGAYARDESFYSWHHFAVTRAMENQCFFVSINRAGDYFGKSIMCGPWVDATHPPEIFSNSEEFRYINCRMDDLVSARETYPFIADKLSDYHSLPLKTKS